MHLLRANDVGLSLVTSQGKVLNVKRPENDVLFSE